MMSESDENTTTTTANTTTNTVSNMPISMSKSSTNLFKQNNNSNEIQQIQMDYLKVKSDDNLRLSKKKRSNSVTIFKGKDTFKDNYERWYDSSPRLWRRPYRERCNTDPCVYRNRRLQTSKLNGTQSSAVSLLIRQSLQVTSGPIGLEPIPSSPSSKADSEQSINSDLDDVSGSSFGSTSSVSFGIRSPPGSPMAPLQSHSETHGQSIIGLNTIGKSPSHPNTNKLDLKSSKQLTPLTPVTASTGRNISPHPQKSSTSLIPAKNEIPEKEKKRKELSSSRQKKFHRHFQQVPKDERVLNYFSCALVSDILLQGHLYITEQHFAFYSNVFGFVTKLLIPTASVIKISKEKTAKIIPNAVGVATADERHVFGSFMSREAAFRLMCSVCLPQLEPVENIPPKIPDVEVSEEYSVEDDSSCSISGNESPPQIVDSNTTTTSTSDASQAIRQRKVPAIEAPKTSELIVNDGKSEDIPNSVKSIAATSISCSSSNTPIKISTSPPPRIVSSPYTIKIKFPTDFHVVYLGLVLTIVLALLSGFLLYRILDIEAKTSYRNSLDFKWDADTDEDVYAKALKWQKEMQTKSTEEAQSILNTNLEQIAKVRRSLETLSLLIHDKNIENDSNQSNDRGYVRDTDSMYHQQEETT